MAIKTYRPYTPSRRYMTGYSFDEITKVEPEKSLCFGLPAKSGRNSAGRITSRFRGWRHKRLYRIIDWKWYDKVGIPAKVFSIEYDPFRTARIALVCYNDGEKRYVLAWKGCKVWDKIMNWEQAEISYWNRKQLKDIPDGVTIYNVEFTPMTKGKMIKSAGWFATITGREWNYILIKLPSGEVRKFEEKCWATIGIIWNEDHKNITIWKAWRQRRKGRKPQVLGKSMNPVDHPHGGGEWHTDICLKYPKASNGRNVAPGIKTRKPKKRSNKLIVSRKAGPRGYGGKL